jgi:hypothetical protein
MAYVRWPWDPEYSLSLEPSDEEARLTAQLGEYGLHAIDANLVRHTVTRSFKVLRVVADAMKAGGFSFHDDASFELHLRRLIGLVASGSLVGLGNLRRPGFSEVCLPD